ncbi:MAG: hypothetical protein ACJAYE_003451 [Candidatus Azotimanducaceae bacterium]|jgi:hypothetical protein
MEFLKNFWRRFLSGGEPAQPLVEMINAAKVDPEIKKSLVLILQMDTFQRRSAIGSLTTRLRMQQAPESIIAGLIQLEDDDFAATALKLLND